MIWPRNPIRPHQFPMRPHETHETHETQGEVGGCDAEATLAEATLWSAVDPSSPLGPLTLPLGLMGLMGSHGELMGSHAKNQPRGTRQ